MDPLPWPKPGQKLFVGDLPDWEHNAFIHRDPADWHPMALGYQTGADVMVEHVMATESDQDLLLFPIMFGYRHSVELRLKAIREILRGLGEDIEIKPGHSLQQLWEEVRRALARELSSEPDDDIQAVDEILSQLHQADEGSFDFRYPADNRGKATRKDIGLAPASSPKGSGDDAPRDGVLVNLRHLRDRVEEVSVWLDATADFLLARIEGRKPATDHVAPPLPEVD